MSMPLSSAMRWSMRSSFFSRASGSSFGGGIAFAALAAWAWAETVAAAAPPPNRKSRRFIVPSAPGPSALSRLSERESVTREVDLKPRLPRHALGDSLGLQLRLVDDAREQRRPL